MKGKDRDLLYLDPDDDSDYFVRCVEATFQPPNTATTRPEAAIHIGERLVFRHEGTMDEDAPFAGQSIWRATRSHPLSKWWLPAEDLVDVVLADRGQWARFAADEGEL